jgi:hypothetical protein
MEPCFLKKKVEFSTHSLLETNPGARINVNRHIRVRPIHQAWSIPAGFPRICYLLWAPFKAAFLAIQLFWVMGCISQKPDFIIVQVTKGTTMAIHDTK